MTTENRSAENLPACLEVPLSALVELAVECWRLERWLAAQPQEAATAQARHVARRLAKFLDERELRTLDLTGQHYSPGLAVEVLDTLEADAPDDATEGGRADPDGVRAGVQLIVETVSPVVTWRGTVVRYGQVVVGGRS